MRQKFVFTLIALLTTTMVWATSGNYGTRLVFATPNSSVINVVRKQTGLSLKEAKELVDKAPCYVLQNVTLEEAQALANALNDVGASARVVDMTTEKYVKLPSRKKSCYFDVNGAYFGPEEEYLKGAGSYQYQGAYFTGDYPSPFKTYLGKTDEEIQAKLDQMWNHYFKGDNNSKVYFDKGTEAYIKDINNNDVRSEGMSYGMMICVQTDHKEEFDKLWAWAKNHMWHKGGGWDGYFAWQRSENGSGGDDNCAPDGEMYFMMSLLFAANRWNDSSYMEDAQLILEKMWENPQRSLFNPQHYVITFQPQGSERDFSDPSYDLPAFVDLFSRWSTTNKDKWATAASNTRTHLYRSSNTTSGLFPDYSNYDGTPHSVSYNLNATKYMYDAMRCAMNFGMDYYLFGVDDERQTVMAKRLIDFFEADNYTHARFNWDGSNPSESYTLGEKGCNAVACYALMEMPSYDEKIQRNLQMAWDADLMTGQYRYYDGLVHYLSMLHLCGAFKIWKNMSEDIGWNYDVHKDNKVNVADVVDEVNRIKNNNYGVEYDFVGDGKLDSKDADAVVKYILKKK